MKTRYEIDVTQEDIDAGVRNHSTKCMVAQSIMRTIPQASKITVDVQTIRFSLPDDWKRLFYLTPGSVQRYVIAFDAGEKIKPFTFALRDPAYETDMRPRTKAGMTRPESKAMVRRIIGPAGKQVIHHTTKQLGKLPPMPQGNSHARYYGVRAMRINQEDTPIQD